MRNLFEPTSLEEVKKRIAQLRPESQRLWGKMTPAQALAHCTLGMKLATGEMSLPRTWLGRLLGPLVKRSLIVHGKPMRRNTPTHRSVLVQDERDFIAERQRLHEYIHRFASGGPEKCTKVPHWFFGPLTPEEWAIAMYVHLDHHLQQFGV